MTKIELDIENKVAWVRVSSHPKFNDLLSSENIWDKLAVRDDFQIEVWFMTRYGMYEFSCFPETKKTQEPYRIKGKVQDYEYDFEPFSWLPVSERPAAMRKLWQEMKERNKARNKEAEERRKKSKTPKSCKNQKKT